MKIKVKDFQLVGKVRQGILLQRRQIEHAVLVITPCRFTCISREQFVNQSTGRSATLSASATSSIPAANALHAKKVKNNTAKRG